MNPFTYTPTTEQAAGIAYANEKAKAAHDAAQASKPEDEREAYAVTDEQYALAAIGRVADNYFQQRVAAAMADNADVLRDAVIYLTPSQKAAMVAQIAAAKGA